MIFYYYAHTGHREDLDGVRRAAALLPKLDMQGIKTKLLINDFRAALAAKEYGIEGAVSVESINDIDLVLSMGDALFIDSSEPLPKNFDAFCRDYKQIFRLVKRCDDEPILCEELLLPWDEDEVFFVDERYMQEHGKKDEAVLFFGDSDPKKELLRIAHRFKDHNVVLLLGEYFYLGYKEELQGYFSSMYEAESYRECIMHSENIITFSLQCAFEARTAGANTMYISKEKIEQCTKKVLERYQITYFENYDFKIDKFLSQGHSKKVTKDPKKELKLAFYIANKINS